MEGTHVVQSFLQTFSHFIHTLCTETERYIYTHSHTHIIHRKTPDKPSLELVVSTVARVDFEIFPTCNMTF